MSDDIWSQKTEYYDDGVKFGTGPQMITEIKSLRSELEEARHRIAELESAIKPFADEFDLHWPDDVYSARKSIEGADRVRLSATGKITDIVIGDLRNARSKLEGKSDA